MRAQLFKFFRQVFSVMLQSWKNCYWNIELATSLTISGAIIALSGNYTLAQSKIVPDSTLGAESSTVTPSNSDSLIDEIRGGAIRGTNLFHSFLEFNVSEGREAYFLSPNTNIQNILARVTGGNPSEIMGILGTRGVSSPNLFLINPNGIIFGPNASLDVGGSFLASTASSLKFPNGTNFSATEPQITTLLTVSVPIGLHFGSSTASILNQSFAADSDGNPVGLQVQIGKTLALVGGDVVLDGSYMTTESGRIEVGSVAGPSLVSLTPTASGWALGYEGVQNFKDIRLTQGAIVFTYPTISEGGDIQVQGRRVTLSDGSFIANVTGGSSSAGTLAVIASESVELIGAVPARDGRQSSSSLRTDTLGSGSAGNLRINTGKLIVRDGARVSVGTTRGSTGQGGTLTVTAASVELSGTSADGQLNSGLFARTRGLGTAGNLTIATGNLVVRDRAEVNVSSVGKGDAGNLEITARSIRLDNEGKLTATTESGKGGGNIRLQDLDLLLLRRHSEISTNAGGNGNGGNIMLNTDILAALENSDITANAVRGRGGNIQVNTQGIFRSPGSDITASSELGINGTVQINTPDVDPSLGLIALPEQVVDVTGLIAQGCSAGGGDVGRGASEFVITGRGGLPTNPNEALSSDAIQVDWVTLYPGVENSSSPAVSTQPTAPEPAPIVEAQGWVIGDNGQVVLTASAVPVQPHSSWQAPAECHATKTSS